MTTGIINPTEFATSLDLGNKLSKAFVCGDFIAGSSPKDEQFVVASINKGQIEERINGNKGIVGPFAYKNKAIHTPIYYKPHRISQAGAEEILTDYKEDMFGATSMHFSGGYHFVVSNNGLYIYDEDNLSLITSFKNTTGSTVSHLNYYFNKKTNLLYLANLQEENGSFIVLCADVKDDFKELWRIKLDGELSKSGDFSVNNIYESEKYIVCPLIHERKGSIVLIDKNTGKIDKKLPSYRNQSIVYQGEKMYTKGFRKNEIVSFDLQTLEEQWACKSLDCKGSLVLFKNKLLSGCSAKGTLTINTDTGESTLVDKKMNIKPVFEDDLRPSLQYYLVDHYLCW